MKVDQVKSLDDCQVYCEGIINDLSEGLIERHEASQFLLEYTIHLHNMFMDNAKKLIKNQEVKIKTGCHHACSPDDFRKGGKCDKNGCYAE